MTYDPKTDLDAGDFGGYVRKAHSVSGALTASATSVQATATDLPATFNRITTCATAGDSVKLPAAAAGAMVVVTNAGAESADVFPQTGEAINAGAANAAVAVASGATTMFVCTVAGTWNTIS